MHNPADLIAGPERLRLGGNKDAGDPAHSRRLFRIHHIFRKPEIRKADPDHGHPLIRNIIAVRHQPGAGAARRNSPIKIKHKAKSVIWRNILRRFRNLHCPGVADEAGELVRNPLGGAHFSIIQDQCSNHTVLKIFCSVPAAAITAVHATGA